MADFMLRHVDHEKRPIDFAQKKPAQYLSSPRRGKMTIGIEKHTFEDAGIISIQPLCVNLREAARILSIGLTSLYKLLESKEIASVKVGRRRVIPMAELQRYIAQQLVNG